MTTTSNKAFEPYMAELVRRKFEKELLSMEKFVKSRYKKALKEILKRNELPKPDLGKVKVRVNPEVVIYYEKI